MMEERRPGYLRDDEVQAVIDAKQIGQALEASRDS